MTSSTDCQVIGVDLAARFSAAVALGASGEVVYQIDSWGINVADFSYQLAEICEYYSPESILVEDVPYGLSRQSQIKPPLRAQGMVISQLHARGLLDNALFIAPATWQRGFGLWKNTPAQFASFAQQLSYTPPDMLERHADIVPPLGKEFSKERSKVRAQLKKATTDYVDAFLIAEFARRHQLDNSLLELQGVQPIEF